MSRPLRWNFSIRETTDQNLRLLQRAIASATTLAEVERLQAMLQAGQIPGKPLHTNGSSRGMSHNHLTVSLQVNNDILDSQVVEMDE